MMDALNSHPNATLGTLRHWISEIDYLYQTSESLTLITGNVVQAFCGLRAAPCVRHTKVFRLGCGKKSPASQSIKAVLNPLDDPILKEAMKVRLDILKCTSTKFSDHFL